MTKTSARDARAININTRGGKVISKNSPVNSDYGPNNPEPLEFKESAANYEENTALDAAEEYINGNTSSDKDNPHMPCKNSVPT